MTQRTTAIGSALLALIGPMIWAAHFFAVYLAEAVLCSPAVLADESILPAGVALTIVAVMALLGARWLSTQRAWRPFVRPLIDLSVVGVLLTAMPLMMVGACKSAGA